MANTSRPPSLPVPTLVVTLALVCAGFVACGGGDDSESGGSTASIEGPTSCDPQAGGSIVAAFNEDLPTFDPTQNSVIGPTAFNATPLVYDRLVSPSVDLENLEPELATSIEANADFTQWTIRLRDGVKFHDGSSLDADDVVFSINYALDGLNAYTLGPISKVTAVDRLTVRIDLSEPYAALESQGLATYTFIFPRDLNGETPEEFFKTPIGTGPYEVASYRPGSSIEYESFPDYWDEGKPRIENLELRIVPDANDRILGLESGDFDFIDRLPADQVDNLPGSTVARVIEPSAVNDVLQFSTVVPLFRDKAVREAISLAIDRQAIADGAFAGFARPAQTFLPAALPNVEPPAENPYVYDIDRAKELMAGSSYPDGGSVDLTYIRGDTNIELEVQQIQEDLSEIGIEASLRPVSASEYFDESEVGARKFVLFNLSAISPDPIDFLGFYADTEGYYGGWPTAPVDRMLDEFNKTDDPAKQQELLTQYETFSAKLLGQTPIVEPLFLLAQSSELSGLNIDPLQEARFADAWLCEGS